MPDSPNAPGKNPGFWIVLCLALLGLALGGAFVGRNAARPSDGARLDPGRDSITPRGLLLAPLHPTPGGLRTGDLLLAVDGTEIEAWSRSLFRQGPAGWRWTDGQFVVYTLERDGIRLDQPVRLGTYPFWAIVRRNWGTIVFALAFLAVAGFVFIRRPDHPAGQVLFLAAAGIASSTAWSFGLTVPDFMDGIGYWLFKAATLGFYGLFWTASAHFALVFPRPLPLIQRFRWLLPCLYLIPVVSHTLFLALTFSGDDLLSWFQRWPQAEGLHAAVFVSITSVVLIVQFRRSPGGVARLQMRWLALAGLISGGGGLTLYILPPLLGLDPIPPNAAGLLALPFPIAIAIAILRHNLFDIDRLINRALVYGALTASTIALYILGVAALGDFLQIQDRSLLAFLTTGLVAVLFQPLREMLQRLVNRWMYGERDAPAAVLNQLGQRLEQTGSPDAALKGIVETVAVALKLPYVAIELGADPQTVASFGVRRPTLHYLPLVYQGRPAGRLAVAGRGTEGELTRRDIALLESIAHQAGVVAHNVQLTADLRRSRQELVTTREEERRRIRRDLHDGLGPQLASQALTLEAVEKLIDRDPEAARGLLKELKAQSRSAVADIRRLIYDLRPPALDDLGLVEALLEATSRFREAGLEVRVQSASLVPLPAAVELAAYRIVLEAVNNTFKHAGAGRCVVTIGTHDGALLVEVADDGQGLPANRRSGVGIQSMRERAEELGGSLNIGPEPAGGIRIVARLPL